MLNFAIFPNPTNNEFTITGVDAAAKVEIFNWIGQKVYEDIYQPEVPISISLHAGIYIVKVTSKDKSNSQKLIVK